MDEHDPSMTWRTYVLRCGDDSFYTGIAKDVARRLAQHAAGRGARYTRGRGPLTLWWQSEVMDHQSALSLERKIKSMTRRQKTLLRERGGGDGCQGDTH